MKLILNFGRIEDLMGTADFADLLNLKIRIQCVLKQMDPWRIFW